MAALAMAVAILVGCMGGAVHARELAPFDDVPPRTWSYAVVDYFAERGWVSHYPGELFATGRTLTRYEMALATRDIVQQAGASAGWTLSPRETLWLQSLVKEYARELELLGYRLERLEPAARKDRALGTVWPAGDRFRPAGGGERSAWTLDPWGGRERGPLARAEGPWVQLTRRGGSGAAAARAAREGDGWQLSAGWAAEERRAVALASGAGGGHTVLNGGASGLASRQGGERLLAARAEGSGPARQKDVLVGAQAMIRLVERASAAWVRPGFPSPNRFKDDERELRSVDLVLDLGDVRLTSPQPDLRRGLEPWQERTAIGPIGFTSGITAIVPRVGTLDPRDDLKDVTTTTASVAGVGMDVVIPSARLRLGWRYEGELGNRLALRSGTTVAGMEYQIDSRAQAVAGFVLSDQEEGQTRTTQLGLRYSLGRDASVLLGYRLIDFNLRDDKRDETLTKMATAEFSLRF